MTHISKEDAVALADKHARYQVEGAEVSGLVELCNAAIDHYLAGKQIYDVEATGNDGKTYGPRLLQTREEMEQFQKVGIVGEIMRIHRMESVPDMALTGRLQ